MSQRPATLLVAGLLCLASAAYALYAGTLGLEFFEFKVPLALAVASALVHLYCGFGLWSGDNLARGVTLWLLGAGFLATWVALYGAVLNHAGFSAYAGGAIKIIVVAYFLWHLSGAGAVAFTGGARGHGEHEGHGDHGDHGHHGHAHP